MEPRQNSPNFAPSGGEFQANNVPIEYSPGMSPERVGEQRTPEYQPIPSGEQMATPSAALPALPVPVVDPQATTVTANPSSTPSVANDDDLIEKEWVEHAKKIIAETKDDPYKREQEIGKLQVDYIRKRYGREIGVAED